MSHTRGNELTCHCDCCGHNSAAYRQVVEALRHYAEVCGEGEGRIARQALALAEQPV